MTERYIPLEVYKNLESFLRYRKVTHDYNFLQQAEFMKHTAHYEYIKISGSRDDQYGKRPFHLLFIAPESKAALNTPNFKKLMNNIPVADLESNVEVVIISKKPLTNFIKTQIRHDRSKYPGLYIEHYEYPMFAIEMPKHCLIPVHTIVPKEEVERFCAEHYTQKNRLPNIFVNDTGVVWLGARPGDVIKVLRESEAVGKAVGYRFVVKAPM